MIELNLDKAFLNIDLASYQIKVNNIHKQLYNHVGLGSEYTYWLEYGNDITEDLLEEITGIANRIRRSADVFLVCGIGGSYLGAKAAIEMCKGLYNNDIEIIYVGNCLSSNYLVDILEYIKDKSIYLNVISKSGNTIETSISFRILKEYMKERYDDYNERIIVTTSCNEGLLRDECKKNDYLNFVVPEGIGGRYSAITPVGLFPMAVAGLDIYKIVKGYKNAQNTYSSSIIEDNKAIQYAIARRILDKQGMQIELAITYEPCMATFLEWWKQLFAESEGKNNKGIFPACACFSADLHSIGQYIQDGKHMLFETIIDVKKSNKDIVIPYDNDNLDNLNYISNKNLSKINRIVEEATYKAHTQDGGVANIVISIDKIDEYNIGNLMYFFFIACSYSVYLLEENPFDQPGVEIYKNHMNNLLKK